MITQITERTTKLYRMPAASPNNVILEFVHGKLMPESAAEILDVGKAAHGERRALRAAL